MIDFSADLRSASVVNDGLRFTYSSSARAFALLNGRPKKIEIDGAPGNPKLSPSGAGYVVTLPHGQHVVQLTL
jgi:hypothetical protein